MKDFEWQHLPEIKSKDFKICMDTKSYTFYEGFLSGWITYQKKDYYFSWIDDSLRPIRIMGIFEVYDTTKFKDGNGNLMCLKESDVLHQKDVCEIKYYWEY